MYGLIDTSVFTPKTTAISFNSRFLVKPNWQKESNSVEASDHLEDSFVFHYHTEDYNKTILPFLNSINNQKKLIEGLDYLAYVSSYWKPDNVEGSYQYTDLAKFAPYLYLKNYYNASLVLERIININLSNLKDCGIEESSNEYKDYMDPLMELRSIIETKDESLVYNFCMTIIELICRMVNSGYRSRTLGLQI